MSDSFVTLQECGQPVLSKNTQHLYKETETCMLKRDQSINRLIKFTKANRTVFMYTGRSFHCYMLDKSICHFRGVRSNTLSLLFYFCWKILFADQMPHYVGLDLSLHCLPMIFLQVCR